jgi:hypothetical protein
MPESYEYFNRIVPLRGLADRELLVAACGVKKMPQFPHSELPPVPMDDLTARAEGRPSVLSVHQLDPQDAPAIPPPGEERGRVYVPPPVTRYRNLSQTQIDLVNRIKAKGDELGQMIAYLGTLDEVEKRWLAIAKTNLQTGMMQLARAVFQPSNF